MATLIIIGSGGHAGVVIEAVRNSEFCPVIQLLDDFLPVGTVRHACAVVGKVADLNFLTYDRAFIAIGDNEDRFKILNENPDGRYVNVIHPHSTWEARHDILCRGLFIAAGARVGNRSTVGDFSIVNTNASLDHDSRLGSFSHLAPGVVTGGRVKIGSRTLVGIGAMIRDGITIGDNCVIGMGSVVVDDVPDNATVMGNPARIVQVSA